MARVLELEPMIFAGYVIGSSMYASNWLWGEAAKMRRLMKEKGVKLVFGYSLVHVDNNEVHTTEFNCAPSQDLTRS
ncbi:hypothetical protein BVC80_9085g19 [Macleaya cordata]|uniref:Pentatricopeptide repeat n=1 Tax=Macleaya cordata TaxID=56857 RepID=A0A200PQZ6_MACCD|nr:hypothetical protein BVC80_9085g19 [Macleaya cordata]